MKLLDRYIIREHIAPFFISISLIMLLFILNLAFKMLGRIVGQGLSIGTIVEYFFLNLAWIVTLAIPMSVLVACLMGFGRLAGDLEIISMKASGISLVRMIRPVFLLALVVCGFSIYFQDQILPDMNHRNKLLTLSIRRKRPALAIRQGIFTKELRNQTLLVQENDPDRDMLYDLTIFDDSKAREPATIMADSGRLAYTDTLGMYNFHLWSGEIHQLKHNDPDGYQIIRYREALFRFNAPEAMLRRHDAGYRGDRELDLAGLLERVDRLREQEETPRTQQMINRYMVEYHKKFAMSFASLVFVLIGAPLGVKLHKGGIGVSGGMSVLFFLIYWTFLIGGEDLADRGLVSPAIAMWAPNILLGILGVFLVRAEMRSHSVIRFPWQKNHSKEDDSARFQAATLLPEQESTPMVLPEDVQTSEDDKPPPEDSEVESSG